MSNTEVYLSKDVYLLHLPDGRENQYSNLSFVHNHNSTHKCYRSNGADNKTDSFKFSPPQ